MSPGLAGGPVYRMPDPVTLPAAAPVSDVAAERKRATAALTLVADDLTRRAEAADGAAGDVLRAQAMMAADPMLSSDVAARVEAGTDAPHAIDEVFEGHRAAFAAAGGVLAERVADLDDLRARAVAACLGVPPPGVPDPGEPFVLAAVDLSPADTAGLDPARVLALVTEQGGPTSHTAILARAAGIPAVVRCAGVTGVADGTRITVDGGNGAVEVDVTAEAVASAREAEVTRRAALSTVTGPGRTACGHRVALLANIGAAGDATGDAEGVGLFRTELMFLDRATAPSFDEQVSGYGEVFAAWPDMPVVVRTLDAGADKPLPFLTQPGEPNPALGVRGLRTARRAPQLLTDQLHAVAAAAHTASARVKVMAPMVSTVAEAVEFAEAARAAGVTEVGVMVEVPAAALQAARLLEVVDFLSIGTNDLSQYTFAADRMAGELADLLDPWQPALLELIAMCARAGTAAGKPVGVCGEAAADPRLAPVLVGLGVTSLSMSAAALAPVRAALAGHTLARCRELAEAALHGAPPP
ncbi:phosphoenolpyruvate--protein phosphotransferase [Stackebrandtia albiflava]